MASEKKHPKCRKRFPDELVDKLPMRKPNEAVEDYASRITPILEKWGFEPYENNTFYIPNDLLEDALSDETIQADPDYKNHGYNVMFAHDFDFGNPDEEGHVTPMISMDLKKVSKI